MLVSLGSNVQILEKVALATRGRRSNCGCAGTGRKRQQRKGRKTKTKKQKMKKASKRTVFYYQKTTVTGIQSFNIVKMLIFEPF